MAKLKITSDLKLEAKLPEMSEAKAVDHSELEKLQQSMNSLANSVTNVNERLKSHESKMMKMVSQARNHMDNSLNNFKDPDEMSKQLEDFKKEINTKHNKMTRAMDELKNQPKVKVKPEVVKEIVRPEVTQITHYKDHDDDIVMLNDRLGNLNKHIMETKKNQNDSYKSQATVNKILIVGLVISLLLHIF